MAYSHGSKAVLKLNDGTLRDTSPFLTSVSFPKTIDTAEVTTLGDTAKEYIVGLQDATISAEGIYDPTLDGYIANIVTAGSAAFEYSPQGTTAGNVKYSGTAILTSYEIATAVDGAGTVSLELQVTGAVTKGTN
jgi:hypothetical protein